MTSTLCDHTNPVVELATDKLPDQHMSFFDLDPESTSGLRYNHLSETILDAEMAKWGL